MNKDRLLHFAHFFFLFIILFLGVMALYIFRGLQNQQFFVVEILSIIYFFWGCLYHHFKGDFHPKIVVEYLLIAIMAVLMLRGAIYR
jgi:hypothetical protein